MAKEPIEVVIRLKDLLSGPAKTVAATIRGIGEVTKMVTAPLLAFGKGSLTVASSLISAAGAAKSMFTSLFSLKNLLTAFATAFVANRIVQSILSTADALDELNAAARRTGVPVEELGRLRIAAKLSNVEFNTLTKSLGILNRNLGKLKTTGNAATKRALIDLNISEEQVQNIKSVSDLLPMIADGLQKLPDDRKVSAITGLLGKAGAELIPALEGGGDKLRASLAEIDRLGLVASKTQVEAADRLTDSVDLLKFAYEKLKAVIIEQIEPIASRVLAIVRDKIVEFARVLKTIGGLIRLAFEGNKDALDLLGAIRDRLLENAQPIAQSMVKLLFRFLLVTIEAAIDGVFIVLRSNLPRKLGSLLINVWLDAVGAFNAFIAKQIPGDNPFSNAIRTAFQYVSAGADVLQFELDALNAITPPTLDKVKLADDLAKNFASDTLPALKEAIQSLKDAAAKTGADVGAELEKAEALLDKFAKKVEETQEIINEKPKNNTFGEGFIEGFFVNLNDEEKGIAAFNDGLRAAEALSQGLIDTLSGGLTDALADIATGAKSVKEAFGDFVRSAVLQIARLITQLLITQAIVTTLRALGVVTPLNTGGPVGGFNSGGKIPLGLPGYAGGGKLHDDNGPNADRVVAKLTPGEFVHQRDAVRYYGDRFMHAVNNRMIPKSATESLTSGLSVRVPPARFRGFNEGGVIPGATGKAATAQPVIVANERAMEELLKGGGNAMLRWQRENKGKW